MIRWTEEGGAARPEDRHGEAVTKNNHWRHTVIVRTITFTSSARDDVVGVYSVDRFALFEEDLDDGSYVGGGDNLDAVRVAAQEFTQLCASLGVDVCVDVRGRLGHR